ncbi:HEPN domain-containing protein [Caulobacter segnis]|uniref:DNA-binding protein n=1 Tax=Caulobacter segnis TaxID=88688 RepID=A0A2W5WND0_9CAUL|nr:HEPN domain-containing protein [Caulobacter segnis]PZR35508.1 MAG: DNA-binding protein [Caulobacter segnis]
MKSNLDHLPERQQAELEAITGHLLRGFDAAVAGGTQPWRRGAKIYKIILFGSYARGDFVDAPETGYQSDFDILVVVSDEKLTDIADYWFETEQRIEHDPTIGRIVNLMVNDLADINRSLDAGLHFFREVLDQGIVLYEIPGHAFSPLRPLTPDAALSLGRRHYEKIFNTIETSLDIAKYAMSKGDVKDWLHKAAFNLHQATEAAYIAVLLLNGFYAPRSHNIKFLRAQAEAKAPALAAVWPRETRALRKPFQKLKRAYVDARYNQDSFEITLAELEHLKLAVEQLIALVRAVCDDRLAQLAREAGEGT